MAIAYVNGHWVIVMTSYDMAVIPHGATIPMLDSPTAAEGLGRDMKLSMYRKMVLIREFELASIDLFKRGEIKGAVHPYIGQEASGVGVCTALRTNDLIAGTHRSHGHNLAKGADPKRMMAEILGKETGYCKGAWRLDAHRRIRHRQSRRAGSRGLRDPTCRRSGARVPHAWGRIACPSPSQGRRVRTPGTGTSP
ncbi:MAG: thiamine pyrophosphate-dependent enzyme [Acidimicrobiia bacterium]|nr:thiamine pyrophosphate-dependent enzyme [Acidimicrobiia bacterium]